MDKLNHVRVHNNFDAFYSSGKNYIEVMWTDPRGNAYYTLAHQFIAAQLNLLAGSDPTPISADMERAIQIFSTYTPAQIGALRGNNPLRQEILAIAARLDQYNNGGLGPEHCNWCDTRYTATSHTEVP